MKYNKNLAGVQITDELINRSSSASARLAHDTILASTVVVRTAPAGGGTLLSLTTDYTLGSEDARLTTEAGGTVNTTLAIVNGAYLNTNLYVTYKTVGDYAEAEDINGIIASVTVSGNYTVGNEQTVNVTAATADITIPSGLPIGTRKTIRKLHATTTSSVNLLRSGSEVFTSASLTTVPIFGNGSFWIIEKVTSTRWDLVGGSDYVSDSNGHWCAKITGDIKQYGTLAGSTNITRVVTFPKPFANTNYSAVCTGHETGANYFTWNPPAAGKLVASIEGRWGGSPATTNNTVSWAAYGRWY
jgi:hypothetical protein